MITPGSSKQPPTSRDRRDFYAAAAYVGATNTGVLAGTGKAATADAALELRPVPVSEEAARVLAAGVTTGAGDTHLAGLAAAVEGFLKALKSA